jgi:hypothetical protein
VEAPGDTIYPNVTGAFSFFACARLCPLVRRQIIAYACDGNCSKQERDYGRVQRKASWINGQHQFVDKAHWREPSRLVISQ